MRVGSFWSHHMVERGRRNTTIQWWLHRDGRPGSSVYLEIAVPCSSWFAVRLRLGGDERELLFSLAFLRLGVWLGFGVPALRGVRPQEWELSTYEGVVRLELGADPDSWSRSEPWWRRWRVEPAEVLFGRMRHSDRVVSHTETSIPMPERAYPCVVTLKDERWQRARLPWAAKKLRRAHVEIDKGVPVPGKGENAWDIDDDAIFSSTFPAETVEQAIAGVVESAMKSRRRYGGSVNWQGKGMS